MISNYILFIASILIGATKRAEFMYAFFVVFLFELFFRNLKKKDGFDYILLLANIYSIILPDNYLIIIFNIITFIYIIVKYGIKNTYNVNKKWFMFCCLFFSYGIIISIFNQLSIEKLLFSSVFLSSLCLCPIIVKTIKFDDNDLSKHLLIMIIMQFVAIISRLIFRFGEVTHYNDLDWVVGTFGEFQSTILFVFCIFSFMYFLFLYNKNKKQDYLLGLTLSLLIAFCTGSIALTIIFIIVSIIWVASRLSMNKLIKLCPIFVVFLAVFLCVNPSWIRRDIVNLLNIDYFKERVSKIETYEDAFVNRLDKPIEYIFGMGTGNYTSRAALTTTGLYIDAYNSIFSPVISEQTKESIYPKLKYVYDNRLGTLDTPFSSVLTIKGEYGLIGLLLVIYCFTKLLFKSNYFQKYILFYFLLICFFENYLEFGKIIFPFILFFFEMSDKKSKMETVYTKCTDLVSICIPAHNNENTLVKCVNSILNQNYSNIEIIIVENNSVDNTLNVCRYLENKYECVKVISTTEKGVSNARNLALEAANGCIIGFCDADDYYVPNVFNDVLKHFEDPSISVVVGGYYTVNSDSPIKEFHIDYPVKVNSSEGIRKLLLDDTVLGSVCNKFYRREIKKIRFDSEQDFLEDLVFNCKYLNQIKNHEILYLNYPIYNYYINEESATHTVEKLFNESGKLRYIDALSNVEKLLDNNGAKFVHYKNFIIAVDTMFNFKLSASQMSYLISVVRCNMGAFCLLFFESPIDNLKYLVKLVLVLIKR